MQIEPALPASPYVDGEEASAVFNHTVTQNTQAVDDSWAWAARHQCRLSVQPVGTLVESQRDVWGFESDDSMTRQTVTTSKKSKSRSTRQRGLARAPRDLPKAQGKKGQLLGLAILKTRPAGAGSSTNCNWVIRYDCPSCSQKNPCTCVQTNRFFQAGSAHLTQLENYCIAGLMRHQMRRVIMSLLKHMSCGLRRMGHGIANSVASALLSRTSHPLLIRCKCN